MDYITDLDGFLKQSDESFDNLYWELYSNEQRDIYEESLYWGSF